MLRLWNTYCLSIATMVARKHLSVTLHVHCLMFSHPYYIFKTCGIRHVPISKYLPTFRRNLPTQSLGSKNFSLLGLLIPRNGGSNLLPNISNYQSTLNIPTFLSSVLHVPWNNFESMWYFVRRNI